MEKRKEKSELEQIKEWKRSLLLEGKMVQDIDEWNSLVEERNDLLEENKKLKKELELVRKNTRANVETLDNMYGENVDLKKENEELQTENENLKSDLEQFSEAYKRYRDFEKEELAESCYDLEKENKKLKEIISQLLWRFLHRNIANIEYEGKKIELGDGDYDYTLD